MTSCLAVFGAQRAVTAIAIAVVSTRERARDGDARIVGEVVTMLVIVALIMFGRQRGIAR